MFPQPRYHAQRRQAGRRGGGIRRIAWAIARLLDTGNVQEGWHGAPPRTFQRSPGPRQWRPYFYGNVRREEDWPRRPQEPVHGTGDPAGCPGEALLWQRSGHLVGTPATNGRRGGLVGPNPEALCGEAPKGQPMIRSESLKAVCVEAPQGQPMIHRRHPIQVV